MVRINNKTKNIFRTIMYIIFFTFLLYLIFELIRNLLGGSLGFEELVIGLLIANIGYSFYLRESINKIDSKISRHIGWHLGQDGRKHIKK